MITMEDESAEEILIDDHKHTLYHLDRYIWQRRERTENRKNNSQDFFIDLLCDFLISQDDEMEDVDNTTRRMMVDNRKLRDDIRLIGHRLIELDKKITPAEKESTPRAEQFAKARCQALARYFWNINPNYTTKELSEHHDINNPCVTGGVHYTKRTIYDWIAEVDPRMPDNKVGRPRKAKKAQ